jgi:hypothetical protein
MAGILGTSLAAFVLEDKIVTALSCIAIDRRWQ